MILFCSPDQFVPAGNRHNLRQKQLAVAQCGLMMNYVEHEIRSVVLLVVLSAPSQRCPSAAKLLLLTGVGVALIWQHSSRTRSGILMKKKVIRSTKRKQKQLRIMFAGSFDLQEKCFQINSIKVFEYKAVISAL